MNGVNLRSRDQVTHRLFLVLPCSASARLVFWAKAGTRNNGNERSVGTCVQGSHDRGGHVSLSRCMYRVVYRVESKGFCMHLSRGHPILFRLSSPAPLHCRERYLYLYSIPDRKTDSYQISRTIFDSCIDFSKLIEK